MLPRLARTYREGRDLHLHGDLRGRVDGAVRVGLETGVHTAGEGIARGVKSGLGSSVVGVLEGENDSVTNGSLDLRGGEGKTASADVDAVGGACRSNGAARGSSDRGSTSNLTTSWRRSACWRGGAPATGAMVAPGSWLTTVVAALLPGFTQMRMTCSRRVTCDWPRIWPRKTPSLNPKF